MENVKSIVIDIADNYNADYTGIRRIEFRDDADTVIVLSDTDFSASASSILDNEYLPKFAFITALSKTGTATNTSWASEDLGEGSVPQRLICVLNTSRNIKSIVVCNYHETGTGTVSGVKNIKIYFTPETATNTVYDSYIDYSSLVFSNIVAQHINTDSADEQILTLSEVENTFSICVPETRFTITSDTVAMPPVVISIRETIFNLITSLDSCFIPVRITDFFNISIPETVINLSAKCFTTIPQLFWEKYENASTAYVPEGSVWNFKIALSSDGETFIEYRRDGLHKIIISYWDVLDLKWIEHQEIDVSFQYQTILADYLSDINAIAMSGDGSVIAVSFHQSDYDLTTNVYSICFFDKTQDGWIIRSEIIQRITDYEALGRLIAFNEDGTVLAVAGEFLHSDGYYKDAIFTYFWNNINNEWTLENPPLFEPNTITYSDQYGYTSISLSGDGKTLAVGASYKDYPGGIPRYKNAGAVYTYARNAEDTGWTTKTGAYYQPLYVPDDVRFNNHFGIGVGLNYNGTKMVVGSEQGNSVVSPTNPDIMKTGGIRTYNFSANVWNSSYIHELKTDGVKYNTEDEVYFLDMFSGYVAYSRDGSRLVASRHRRTWTESNYFEDTTRLDTYQSASRSDFRCAIPENLLLLSSEINSIEQIIQIPITSINLETTIDLVVNGDAFADCSDSETLFELQSDVVAGFISGVLIPETLFVVSTEILEAGFNLVFVIPEIGFGITADVGDIRLAYDVYTTGQRGAVVVPNSPYSYDNFGSSVALSANGLIMAVGSIGYDSTYTNQGAVYIFDWSGSAWVQRATILKASDAAANDSFGSSLALSDNGNILVVGSQIWEGSVTDQGGVYIYDWSGSGWVQRGSVLTASDAADSDFFGCSLALSDDGNILVVGAKGWEGSVTDQGGVYIYDWSGSGWVQRGSVLTASDAADSDFFGCSLALSDDGNILVVGSQSWEDIQTGQGGVYTYDWSGSAWVKRGSVLTISNTNYNALMFGSSVAFSDNGSILVVGAKGQTVTMGLNYQGAVYTYDRSGTAWVPRLTITASDAAASDAFGSAVALSDNGDILAIGAATWELGGATNQGGVYIYAKQLTGTTVDSAETEINLNSDAIYSSVVPTAETFFVLSSDINDVDFTTFVLTPETSFDLQTTDITPLLAVATPETITELISELTTIISIDAPEMILQLLTSALVPEEIKLDIPESLITLESSIVAIKQFQLKDEIIRYYLTITGDADFTDNITIPMTSFQARRNLESPTYLSVVIPSLDFVSDIRARYNGVMRIEQGYIVNKELLQKETIIETAIDNVDYFAGGRNQSISLSGYKTLTYQPKAITLTTPTYKSIQRGKIRYRLAKPYVFLNPGDVVTINDDTFTVSSISYAISTAQQQIEIEGL